MSNPLEALRELSFQFGDPPFPGHAKARIEIFTPGGSTCLTMPAIKITCDGGEYMAEIEDAGRTWYGEGSSQTAAIIALLADRAGYRAVVTCKEDE
jgi:hypothetical protein